VAKDKIVAKLRRNAAWGWVPVIAGIVLVFGIGGGILALWRIASKEAKPTPVLFEPRERIQDGLFLAIRTEESIKIILYNLREKREILTREVALNYPLFSLTQTSGWGSNNAVQYFDATKEVFYLTDAGDYLTGGCAVKPVTTPEGETLCGEYLYKVNLLTGASTILAELRPSAAWILNNRDGFIYLSRKSVTSPNELAIQKVDTQNGSISTLAVYRYSGNASFGRLAVSQDGKYIYQASREDLDGGKVQVLKVVKIDTQDGKTETIEVYRGSAIEWDTNLSHDGRKIAFYAEPEKKLLVFDILDKKLVSIPNTGEIKNFSLLWSGDNSKILYLPKGEGYTYYDLENSVGYTRGSGFPFLWAPSPRYIVSLFNKRIEVFDVTLRRAVALPPEPLGEIKRVSEIVGFGWFTVSDASLN
jgi:VCBS repeat-containing protein